MRRNERVRERREPRSTSAFDVACFGEVLWDFYETRSGVYERHPGGASVNAAIALAGLGLRALIVGAVGTDSLGEDLARALAARGVDVSGLVRSPRRTGLVFVARGRFVPYRAGTADGALSPRDVPRACGAARWGLVGTTPLAQTERAVERFSSLVLRGGGALAVDLNARPQLWPSRTAMRASATRTVARAALVKASRADLERLAGSERAGLTWLARAAPGAVVLVTRGSGPASALGPRGRVDVPARPVRCVDPVGGGDAFLAGALAVIAAAGKEWSAPDVLTQALRIGHRLGASAVRRVGATTGLDRLEKKAWHKIRGSDASPSARRAARA